MTINFDDLSRSAVEQKVVKIWKDELGVVDGASEATFFELNGQSISAVRISARIEEELGVMVDIGDLFEDPDLQTFVNDVLAKVESAQGLVQ